MLRIMYLAQWLEMPLFGSNREIQRDFGFTDQQKDQLLGGWIGAAFFLVGAPSALLMGALAHSHNRRNLLFIVVLIGEP